MAETDHSGWDPAGYERHCGFVAALGRGVVDLLAPQPGERILDLGCGTGTLTAEIAAAGAEAWGLDADPAMIARARAQHPGLRFVVGDGQDFDLGARFDAVFSNAALHWMPRPGAVADAVFAALRPGGRFVAELGGKGNIAAIIDAVRAALRHCGVGEQALGSTRYYPSPAEYAAVLEDAGFLVRRLEYFERPTPLDDCPEGVADWLRVLGGPMLAEVPDELREQVITEAAAQAAPQLWDGRRWYADYRRLRFVAERPQAAADDI